MINFDKTRSVASCLCLVSEKTSTSVMPQKIKRWPEGCEHLLSHGSSHLTAHLMVGRYELEFIVYSCFHMQTSGISDFALGFVTLQ